MAKNRDGKSWEDRIGDFGDSIGNFADSIGEFDRMAADVNATLGEAAADELALAVEGMTAKMALSVVRYYARRADVRRVRHEAAKEGFEVSFAGMPADGVPTDSAMRADQSEQLMEVLSRIVEQPKSKLTAGALMLASGMTHPAVVNVRQWAAKQMVSPEHVSNEVAEWQRRLKLPKTSAQKSEDANANYRDRNQVRKAG